MRWAIARKSTSASALLGLCASGRVSTLLLMLPNSATGKRTIEVAAGTSHSRTINTQTDPNNVPIVERMTRSRLDKMSASQVAKWRNESIKAIKDLSPRKSERDAVITQYFERRHTHEAPSPLNKGSSSSGTSEEPASTPGKWCGKKKTDSGAQARPGTRQG